MEKNIIQLYEEIKGNERRFPRNIWTGSEGKAKFIKLFKYLRENKDSKEELKKLTLKYFRENHIYTTKKIF